MEKKENNKSGFLKIVFNVILFLIGFEIIGQTLGYIIGLTTWQTILNGKYSLSLIIEVAVLIVTLLYIICKKDWTIFEKPKEKFRKSIKMCWPILLISTIFLGINFLYLKSSGEEINYLNLLSLIFFTAAIGLFEEIFYRGIVQNRLVKSYSHNRKELLISLIISSLLFGFAHLTNILSGQGIFTTITQVLQTASLGLVFGVVYYITKNIWAVAFLHGFYDFAIILSDVNLYKDCTYTNNVSLSIAIINIISSLLLAAIFILYAHVLLEKNKAKVANKNAIDEEINVDEVKTYKKYVPAFIILIVLFCFVSSLSGSDEENYYVCYDYEVKNITNVETHYFNYDNFNINTFTPNGESVNLEIALKNGRVKIKNIALNKTETLIYKNVVKLAVFEYQNTYQILILVLDEADYKLYLSDFIKEENINNSIEYFENIKTSFKEYIVPDSVTLGYVKDAETGIIYPMARSTINDIFIIDNDKVYIVK